MKFFIMNAKKKQIKDNKVEEPALEYEVRKSEFKGIDRDTFDFDAEFANGLTREEFKEEMFKRIKAYPWGK
ncbi:hypothetical protein SGQ83_06420 [Flavobacterium sp. Fl-318]|uniref:Uncharacterized protein n=1 Tax=Flavobacterium cupriresistens TaxID=2893885 RepID=A0ABU4R8U6_9FLAO|nr:MULTISPECIES: hypothetical protein [unclassified Flavobacterium]MDX6188974.1 hypothetical protein [Flavobacterium sp. Fl-318]UFH44245.1 hypothetical protein LNP23_08485 [Flavobacterium sp. F-323]